MNPFTPTEILGEGGKGSGKELPAGLDIKARRKIQLKNAQRVYREKNRENYNKAMRELYDKKKNDKQWYEAKKESARKANSVYRAKKRYNELTKDDGKALEGLVVKKIKEKFDAETKRKKGRPKKDAVKPVFDDEYIKKHYEEMKAQLLSELVQSGRIMNAPIENYVSAGTNADGRPIYVKKQDLLSIQPDYNYAQQIGNQTEQTIPVDVLNKYYEEVILPRPSKAFK